MGIRTFINELKVRIPETIKSLGANPEISIETKAEYKTNLTMTKGFNELFGLTEAIAIEMTRDQSHQSDSDNQLKNLKESVTNLSQEIRDFIIFLPKCIEVIPTSALYEINAHLIGVILIMVYSFVVAFNLSFIRLTQSQYEESVELSGVIEQYLDLLLPLFGIPGYILLHYISTRTSMKMSFILSILALIIGNAFYYLAYDLHVSYGFGGYWFYIIGKSIIVSRLPMYGVKQFIGFNVTDHEQRVKLATCFVAVYFLGLSCGYFLSLGFIDYSGSFLTFTSNGQNIGGLLFAFVWIMICCFCSVLFVNPAKVDVNTPTCAWYVKLLTIFSYILPFIVLQAFVSNHAVPRSLRWDDEKFFTFLGVFCLMAVPMHMLVYISSYFTTDLVLISASKGLVIVAALLQLCRYYSKNNQDFFYVIGSLLVVMGVNLGLGANFSMLAGNIRNRRIGLFAGILEVVGYVLGNFAVEYDTTKFSLQLTIIVIVCITLGLDLAFFNKFNPKKENIKIEPEKKDN